MLDPSTTLPIDEALLPLTDEDISLYDDDKTLSELLNSLHSTTVRRMHKYTDEQLALMHKHTEYNRMLEAYVDVSIYNGHVSRNDVFFHVDCWFQLGRTRRLLDELLVDQERRQSMKHLSWRYVSSINVYNTFFFAYADKVVLRMSRFSVLPMKFFFFSGESNGLATFIRKDAKIPDRAEPGILRRSVELSGQHGLVRFEDSSSHHSRC
jgi:hypothetical protein